MDENNKGFLIIIGGAEDKTGNSVILKQAGQLLQDGEQLTVLTTATEEPQEAGEKYRQAFERLRLKNIKILNINTRKNADDEQYCQVIRSSRCVFMTGGDQLRITSILGGTMACGALRDIYFTGGTIMGTVPEHR